MVSALLVLVLAKVTIGSIDVLFTGDCDYSLMYQNEPWFQSADTYFYSGGKKYSCLEGSLKLLKLSKNSGSDEFGDFTSHDKAWHMEGSAKVVYATITRVYDDMVKFSQQFPLGLNDTGSGNQDSVTTAFPAWNISQVHSLKSGPRGYVSFGGHMCAADTVIGGFNANSDNLGSGLEFSGPLAIFATNGDTLVTSSASEFMSSSQYFDKQDRSLSWGVMGSVLSIPVGFAMDFIVVAAPRAGVNHAMDTWGTKLLDRFGKSRDVTRSDFTTNFLGYSTDNGAFYYYYTEDGNKTYQDTIIDVAEYAAREGIPYRHWLMDSWWYYKGNGGGVKDWTAMPSIFPDGADYVFNQTGWPVVAHNRYWAYDTVYAKQNGGKWDFILEKESGLAFPLEQGFWDELLATGKKWGLRTYEQDWLFNEFSEMKAPLESATLARQWLMQMGTAAEKHDLTIQYCMSWPRHILQSVELPAVTQARASSDYHPGGDQWIMGLSSIFANAVALKPTKDNYWSSDSECCGKYGTGTREVYNRLHSAVSSLSTGPVAPSDAIGKTNVPLVMKACAMDGRLLQPDRPATRTHASIAQAASVGVGPRGEVWTTEATVSDVIFKLVFAAQSPAYDIPLSEMFEFQTVPFQTYLALEANASATDQPIVVNTASHLKLADTDKFTFLLYALSPVLPNGLSLLGERSKWVPVSTMRFPRLEWSGPVGSPHRHIAAEIKGTHAETVTVSFFDSTNQHHIDVVCVLGPSGTAEARLDVFGTHASTYRYQPECN